MIAQAAPRSSARRPGDIVSRMAAFMIEHSASAGSVTRDDLLLEFTGEEIDEHGEAAKRRARSEAGLPGARQ